VVTEINNTFYDSLGADWLHRSDHPIAFLRVRNGRLASWVSEEIRRRIGSRSKVLDIGCGAGFLANYLANQGFEATGIDLSESSLHIAKANGKATFQKANGYSLPFPNHSFDAVCAMDILEHVDTPNLLIAEASRVLRPGGLLFFHTYNRNWISYFFVIRGIRWFVRNTPKNMHVYSYFIRPDELHETFEEYKLRPTHWRGFRPKFFSALKILRHRTIPTNLNYQFCRSKLTGYCGIAEKQVKYWL
jgi:2-polyprenyl-6-hydroxyphenyl methylase/3-demethylubiquinone-9 3-methyltransferase